MQLVARHIGACVHEKRDLRPLFNVNSPNLSTWLSTMNSMNSCLYCSMGRPFPVVRVVARVVFAV